MNQGLLGFPRGASFPLGLLGYPLGRGGITRSEILTFNQTAGQTYFNGVDSSASANTKGSWTDLVAAGSCPWDADGIILNASNYAGAGTYLLDLALGAAGSERTILENFLFAGRETGSATNIYPGVVFVPLGVPGGERLSGRAQGSSGSTGARWMVSLVRGGFYRVLRQTLPKCRSVTYGAVDSGDTAGASLDPGGSANAKGVWTDIAVTTEDHRAFLVCPAKKASADVTAHVRLDIAAGVEANLLLSDWYLGMSAGGSSSVGGGMGLQCPPLLFADVPAGTRLLGRTQSSITTAGSRVIDVTVIGFS